MKLKIILLSASILAIVCLYFGYEKYKKNSYEENAVPFKEIIYTANRYARYSIDNTHKSKLRCSDLLKSAQGKQFRSENESQNYHVMILKQVMDITTLNDRIKKKCIDEMESSLKNANSLMKEMRKNKDYFPSDHLSFENALKIMRNLINKYKNEDFTIDIYNSCNKDINEIEELLSETDVEFGEISEDKKLQISLSITENTKDFY